MQGLTDSPRQALTPGLVTDLLQRDPTIKITYGAIWLDEFFTQVGDLSQYMSPGSTVTFDDTATTQATCSLNLDSNCPINYVTDFVKPYMVLTDPASGASAQFYLGVYTLVSPVYDNSALPTVLTVTGMDLTRYLEVTMPDAVTLPAGTDPITAAITILGTAISGATVHYTDTTSVLASQMSWVPGVSDVNGSGDSSPTYLDAINDLLDAAGYFPLWIDWNGEFHMDPYVTPLELPVEYTFDLTASDNIVAESRTSSTDLFDVPNTWVFIMQNIAGSPAEGTTQFTYVDNNPSNPGSVANRGRNVYSVNFVDAVDYPSLVQAGMAQIVNDLSPAEIITLSTSPFPLAWHYDRVFLIDPNLANVPPTKSTTRQLLARGWTITLDGTSDMQWTFQTVTL